MKLNIQIFKFEQTQNKEKYTREGSNPFLNNCQNAFSEKEE